MDAVGIQKHSKNPLTLLLVDYFFPVHLDYDLFFLLYLELQRSAEQMMRCESAATQGLRSDKIPLSATERRVLKPHPAPPLFPLRVADLHALSLLAWHPVNSQP